MDCVISELAFLLASLLETEILGWTFRLCLHPGKFEEKYRKENREKVERKKKLRENKKGFRVNKLFLYFTLNLF